MNMIAGGVLVLIALVMILRFMPPLKSNAGKVFCVSILFGVWSMLFGLDGVFAWIGLGLQIVGMVCCAVAGRKLRIENANKMNKCKCRKLRDELYGDFENDKKMFNLGYRMGYGAGESKKID